VVVENEKEYCISTVFILGAESFENNILERFKYRPYRIYIIKSFKCLLPTGNTSNQAEKSRYLKLLKFYKNYKSQNGVNATDSKFGLWCKMFHCQNHSFPHNISNQIIY
jgi:hypothetical protein